MSKDMVVSLTAALLVRRGSTDSLFPRALHSEGTPHRISANLFGGHHQEEEDEISG